MAAFQVTTTTSVMLPATNNAYETVIIQNLGPNAIFVELAATTATTTGVSVAATTGTLTVRRPPLTAISAITTAANQASPADTRFQIQ